MTHVMIDLETMGKTSTAAIVSIGAVAFDPAAGTLGESFYRKVDLQDCLDAGLTMDASTVEWWLKQSEAARAALAAAGTGLFSALHDFWFWLDAAAPDIDTRIVWANGASFDFAILANAFRAADCADTPPWHFWNERCARTLMALARDLYGYKKPKPAGTAHNALDDATFQAQIVMDILAKLSATTLVTIAENLRAEAAA